MSISSYRSTYERLLRDQAAVQSKIADETAKAVRLRAEIARYRDEAMRTTNASTRASRLGSAESKERDLANVERRLGDLMKDRARLDARVGTALRDLRRAETTENERQERDAKRRRGAEMAHVRSLTLEAERQATIQRTVAAWLDLGAAGPHFELMPHSFDLEPTPSPSRPASPPRRRPGRPSGPYLIGSKEEIESAYRELWLKSGRRPSWKEVAIQLSVGERTLRNSRQFYGVDARHITFGRPNE